MANVYEDDQRQAIYNIIVIIEYYNINTKLRDQIRINPEKVVLYEVSKDSVNYNYNLHLLTLTGIEQELKRVIELEKSRIIVVVEENGRQISETKFILQELVTNSEQQEVRNLQLLMISEITQQFRKSTKYSKVSTLDTAAVDVNLSSYELMSKILQKISSDFGSELDVYYYDAGAIKHIYQSIRIPDNLNDLDLFDFIFDEYPPYLIKPYLILDDFHFGDTDSKPVNLMVHNLCDLTGSYNLANTKNIKGYNIGTNEYLGNAPLADFTKIYDKLKATLMIKNNLHNKLVELKPLASSKRSGEVIQIESTLDVNTIKNQLYIQKRLADFEATLESYRFRDLNLGDISFMNVYNITDVVSYNHLPVCLKYRFTLTQVNTYRVTTIVDFAKVPSNLLAGS